MNSHALAALLSVGVMGLLTVGLVHALIFIRRTMRDGDHDEVNIIRPGRAPAAGKAAMPASADKTKYGETAIISTFNGSVFPIAVLGAAAAWSLSESSSPDSSCSFDADSSVSGE